MLRRGRNNNLEKTIEKMKKKWSFILILITVIFSSCSNPNPEKIANEFCNCRNIEAQNGPVQGEQCFNDWDRKYGKLRFSEAEMTIFKTITITCNSVHGK